MKCLLLIALTVTCAVLAVTRPAAADPNNSDATKSAEATPLPTHLPKKKLQPFLKEFCIECHGPDEQEADIRFDQVNWSITNNDTAQRWQDVLDQLNGGDMPPVEADEFPDDKELAVFLDTLTGSVNNARKRLTDHGGEIKMRRLNKREYVHTTRDLFGFDIDINDIPDDGEIGTYDTVGEEQFYTSAHFERYLELGRKIATKSLSIYRRAIDYTILPALNDISSMQAHPTERTQ